MSLPDCRKNDVGTELVVAFVDEEGAVINIASASTKTIILRKPGIATAVTKTGVFDTDGTDGLLKYVTAKVGSVYDLDTIGEWEIQGFAVIGTNEWHTSINKFTVGRNLN